MDHTERERIRIVYHPTYLTDYTTASCEMPSRLTSIMGTLAERFTVVRPDPCTDEDILLCHSEGILISEKRDRERFEVARLAVGGAIRTVELALEGYVAFGAVRPPGHHANPDHNWGFCFFNNTSIAIRKMKRLGRIRTAAILDIDLHFGDGTDTIFKDDPDVRVINIQSSNPGDFVDETAAALRHLGPRDLIVISAGFDQYEKDWGGNLSTEDYREIGALSARYAAEHTGGRLCAVLEGGYYIPDLGANAHALIEGMCTRE